MLIFKLFLFLYIPCLSIVDIYPFIICIEHSNTKVFDHH